MASHSRSEPRAFLQRPVALILLCVLFAGIVGFPTLTYRFGRDQAMFAYVADGWLHGHMPYRDSWDNKPPATYALQALAMLAFGRSQLAPRLADLILTLCIVFCIFLLTEALANRAAACVAAMGYSLAYYLHFDFWHTAQAEVPTSLFALLGLLAAWKWRRGAYPRIMPGIAGACVGLSTLFKITGALVLPVILAVTIWSRKSRDGWRDVITPSMMVAGGFLFPLGVAAAYFAAQGALPQMWDLVVRFNMNYAGQRIESTSLWAVTSALAGAATGMVLVVPLALVGLFEVCIEPSGIRRKFILSWFAASVLMVVSQHRFFWYHWLAVLPPLSVLAGIGTAALVERIRAGDDRRGKTPYWIVLAAAVATVMNVCTPAAMAPSYGHAVRFCTRFESRQRFDASFTGGFNYDYVQGAKVAAYVRQNTTPSETVAVWAFEPEIQFLAARRAPSRFAATHPLFDPNLPYKKREWLREFLADCVARPPTYFVTVQDPAHPTQAPAELGEFSGVRRFLQERYLLERRIGQFKIYRSKAAKSP